MPLLQLFFFCFQNDDDYDGYLCVGSLEPPTPSRKNSFSKSELCGSMPSKMIIRPLSYSLKHPKASLVEITRTRNESVGVLPNTEKSTFESKTLSTKLNDTIGSGEVILYVNGNIKSRVTLLLSKQNNSVLNIYYFNLATYLYTPDYGITQTSAAR